MYRYHPVQYYVNLQYFDRYNDYEQACEENNSTESFSPLIVNETS